MKKVLNPNFQAGSATCNEPRLVGDILAEMLSSDSLFVKAFRHCTASHEDAAAGGQAADEDYAAVERETDFFADRCIITISHIESLAVLAAALLAWIVVECRSIFIVKWISLI